MVASGWPGAPQARGCWPGPAHAQPESGDPNVVTGNEECTRTLCYQDCRNGIETGLAGLGLI